MFVIKKINDGYYFHKKGKIILFNTPQEAQAFFQAFRQFSIEKTLKEFGPEALIEVEMTFAVIRVIEKDFEEIPPCRVVYFRELLEK